MDDILVRKGRSNNMDEYLVCFESGHYKSFQGTWKGDSVWVHFKKNNGAIIHMNKDKIEYIEHTPLKDNVKLGKGDK